MIKSKMGFLISAVFFTFMMSSNAWAIQMGTIQSAKVLDSSNEVVQVELELSGETHSCRVDNETTVVLRFPADQIVKGDRIWINQNVTGFKGVEASIPLSPAASKWFGIPRVGKVPKVPAYQKVPELDGDDKTDGMIDGQNAGAERVESVERTNQGVTFTTVSGKKHTFSKGQRLWKVVSPSGLRSGMVVKADLRSGNRLKQLWVGSSN